MKLGFEQRNKTIGSLLLLALALFLMVRMLRSASAQRAAAAPATQAQSEAARAGRGRLRPARGAAPIAVPISPLDPTLRLDLLRSSEQTSYQGSGRNIFKTQQELAEIPQPVKSASTEPAPGPPQPPPPINLKFYGFASGPGEPKKVFLSQGEDIFIAGEGDIVDRRYKILRIGPNSIEVEDVLNNHRQTIFLTQG